MDLTHIHAFVAAMQRKDLDAMLDHMADGIVLNTPLVADPVEGKAAIRQVVVPLLRLVDRFDFREVMEGPRHVSSFFTIAVGPLAADGMDFWRLDEAGLIAEMTVLWRPLPVAAAIAHQLTEAA
ncbi:MAG TPA: nuclear transport factor 2 family protein [Rhodopila sp.]|uniref:nuclear transport factor 2 family protein n=1 Tax=Rhodopila sp. TaxID=2480087 RepID=UPI002B50C0FE|nr:nuclear transport factor 2 family protein [Rhodopila sp.]HVY14957.1 nuclear transport factor 2 family protein [Rhodopila sp.]